LSENSNAQLMLLLSTVKGLLSSPFFKQNVINYASQRTLTNNALMKIINSSNKITTGDKIQIIHDPSEINKIQKIKYDANRHNGMSIKNALQSTKVGIVARDEYMIWVRNAVRFPSGTYGLYNKFISMCSIKNNQNFGAIILPVFENKDIGTIIQYRHPTQSWELELPRGNSNPNESALVTAIRELNEETGLEATEWNLLGNVAPDSGVLANVIPIYLATGLKINSVPHLDNTEVIDGLMRIPLGELMKLLKTGSFIKNNKTIYIRDSFLLSAICFYLAGH
jgi:8-oxo-dGTP pyrophosphatase MutT (NUDIX family)